MKRIVVGISGASGVCYGVEVLRLLRDCRDIETHLVVSPAALRTLREETELDAQGLRALATVNHSFRDIGASIASGSFPVEGMIIAPCSVRTLGALANALNDNLMVRAADVCLKERRPVVLMLRETPLHLGHIELMERVTRYGGIIMPPVPAFYHKPQSLEELVTQSAARALGLLGVDTGVSRVWTGHSEG
ncbi:UbiX family flavin prenyltransferase [Alkalilimnicola sp. S0819]|nr:UbiX family flavin prenyltransferase [Alkalilimnicola sp. S0819]MPQ15069.1 UbiX family flavin prenyltransferase [Alkalilimnicola sp. S0819]